MMWRALSLVMVLGLMVPCSASRASLRRQQRRESMKKSGKTEAEEAGELWFNYNTGNRLVDTKQYGGNNNNNNGGGGVGAGGGAGATVAPQPTVPGGGGGAG